ncbi:PLP-dependent aminotransferase family protein [Clostridium boliviensis]|uniref:PLP-dependent aminotransferase family protein n=1 Tax=Clostridium boliviensis TaxID=318465 RepID=A0ABU4GER2_9CLOT|nr:PLP-dependent aminotransferase family protein [Clostridium boliviensis]MDW2796106.1 PLP-dependent aminotransferase family protein [Clostridium boliviensis]
MKKSEEVKKYISHLVEEGKLKNGSRLPSCRETAAKLEMNKITVNRAYREIEEEHKVYSIQRGGFYLADFDLESEQEKTVVDFTAVRPDKRLLPYREFTHVMNKSTELYKTSAYDYEEPKGLMSLRNVLKSYLMTGGIYTSPDQILVTNGAQQAIGLALQCIFQERKGKLLVEIPTYSLVIKQAQMMGIQMIGIERTSTGYDFKKLEKLLKEEEIRAFYLIPRHHNPTGYSLSEKDKRKVADLSNIYSILLIEDDYLADLGSGKNTMPVHYYGDKESVIYIRSFSKTFMPGLRIGAGVFPKYMADEAAERKRLADLNTSKPFQYALELFIETGMYEKHIRKVRKIYSEKLKKASAIYHSLKSEDMNWYIPDNGIFIWVTDKRKINGSLLERNLKEQGIIVKNAEDCFLPGVLSENRNQCYRLCLSGVTSQSLERLSEVITAFQQAKLLHGKI